MTARKIIKAVLVITGAWHVPYHYRKLIAGLEEKGIRTICPCLPTNNNAVPPNKTVLDDIALIRDIVSSEVAKGTQLTVLAHSYGGVIATAALGDFVYPVNGDLAQGGVTNIIYMASFMIMEGETLAQLCGGSLPPFVVAHEDGSLDVDDPAYYFYSDLPDNEVKESMKMLVTHQAAVHFTNTGRWKAVWRMVPTSYLICEGDTALVPPAQEMIIGRVKAEGIQVREFRCGGGHSPFLSMPEKVVEVVLEVMGSR
ncbi:hypothetical protein VP1G_00009 [Cytospora mali]|uniref:AB hydrolase-1 domain-containing protein n=1 Tax=Cytospora mali TaxID=578113 RepID=A0A194UMI8_CYTMA|nr:hypothetical protein VP1G_00009 [Valsa mali var. pyri (nom. inval.)]